MSAPFWSPEHEAGSAQQGSNADWASALVFAVVAVPFAAVYLMVAALTAPLWLSALIVIHLRHGDTQEAAAILVTLFVLLVGAIVVAGWVADPGSFLWWLIRPFASSPVTSP
jgi:hypothetical protein